jgi:anaerobic selenocysteine-containing dehydrogenase
MHPETGARHGVGDGDWIDISSHHGTMRVQAKFARNTQVDTVWSGNAIGKRRGAWLHTPNQLYHHYANINKLNLVNFLMIMTI